MQLYRLWCKTVVAVVMLTTATCQIVPKIQTSRRSIANANAEEILRRATTKQNTSNFANGFQSHQDVVDDTDEITGGDNTSKTDASQKPQSRKKRLIWITDDGRLALPPGTVLSITPTLSLPLVRYPLEGFLSNMTMSFPLTIDFDKLGLTDNENPLGVLPPLFARSMGRAAGSYLADYIGDYLLSRRTRSTDESSGADYLTISKQKQPTLPENQKHAFHGGERAILYGIVEDLLATFGMDGKACLLRAICEVHSTKSLNRLGLFGEIAKLFFTATKSNFAHMLEEYVTAQEIGEGKQAPAECFPYYKACPKSIFKFDKSNNNKYSDPEQTEHSDNEVHDDEMDDLENIIQLDGIEKEIRSNQRTNGPANHPIFNF